MKIMRQLCIAFFIFVLCIFVGQTDPAADIPADMNPELNEAQLAPIAEIVENSIREGKIPGAVVLVGTTDKIVYRKAFGFRSIRPKRIYMTEDTIFDIASLTKVVATTIAVMQLVENGKLDIEDPVHKYWPEFKANGKKHITIRELLTHYSGLRPDLRLKPRWYGYKTALNKIVSEKPIFPHGTQFVYSDINFQILGELVRRVSGKPLDIYCAENIFKPLGMKDTGFKPSSKLRSRIAPTQYVNGARGGVLLGEVHDPIANKMGGVAGHAGLFSTADDLAIFTQMILNEGSYNGVQILNPSIVKTMTTPQSPPDKKVVRGFGWDIDSPFSSNRGELFPLGSYGHTGFTGTSIWIDPFTKTYVIILTNRVHPYGKGDAKQLWKDVATVVASTLGFKNNQEKNGRKVQTGIDVLDGEDFLSLSGLRIGLITNHSGLDSFGRRTIDILYNAPDVKLTAIFNPEHGLSGNLDEKIDSAIESVTGLPVYSLYGDVTHPTEKMLDGLDALVFDIQDAGVRFYTYITTMGYAMEAAAKKGIAFYVLDRPNPITGSSVQGPLLDEDLKSFTGYFSLPIRHGMTVGELAEMFNNENKIGVNLHIIKMQGYNRTDWYDETGLQWVNPSPNLRSLTEAILYPGVAMVEGANVSVGRGTDTPFELLGAPWINAEEFSGYLNNRNIQGVKFMPVDFIPKWNRFSNEICHGVQIILVERQTFNPVDLGVEIASALYKLYPKDFLLDKTIDLIGSREVLQAIKDGRDPSYIALNWQGKLEDFLKLRSKYLLY